MINSFQELYEKLTQYTDDKHRNTVDLVQQALRAQESRYDQKLSHQKDEILTGVGEIIDGGISPQISDHENRIIVLEKKTLA